MRINQSEIIDAILEHIRQHGGDLGEWCVGTPKEMQGPGIREQGTGREVPQTLENRSELPHCEPEKPTVANAATVASNSG
jgi:hypothetical protein